MPRAVLSAQSVPEAALSVTEVSKRLGVSASTLRTWERRYGVGPEERALSGRFRQRRSSCTWENRPFHGARRLFFDFMRFPAAQRSASSRSHVRRGGLLHMGGIFRLPSILRFP